MARIRGCRSQLARSSSSSKTPISLESCANSQISKQPRSIKLKPEQANVARAWLEIADVEATSIGQARLANAEFARGWRTVADVEAAPIGQARLEHDDSACAVGPRAKFELGCERPVRILIRKVSALPLTSQPIWIHQLNLRAWYARAHTST